jgi:hypothetical protein
MLVGVLMRAWTLVARTLKSAHTASGEGGEDAAPAEDEANCGEAVGKSGGGGKAAVVAGNGDSKPASPLNKVSHLFFLLQ